jgi:hypothetical protein
VINWNINPKLIKMAYKNMNHNKRHVKELHRSPRVSKKVAESNLAFISNEFRREHATESRLRRLMHRFGY